LPVGIHDEAVAGKLLGLLLDTCRGVCATLLLIEKARGDEEVEGCFEGLLGLMVQREEPIPAGSSECTRRVVETVEVGAEVLIRGVLQRNVIEFVGLGIVVNLLCGAGRIPTDTSTEVVDTAEIGLYLRAPCALEPGVAVLL
jgi:hypothetical protein